MSPIAFFTHILCIKHYITCLSYISQAYSCPDTTNQPFFTVFKMNLWLLNWEKSLIFWSFGKKLV